MQSADNLEAKQAKAKADWECWKKSEEQFKQIHGIFSFDLDDINQEQACQDACTRERDNADVSQMAKEMDIALLPISFSLTAWVLPQRTCSKEMEGGKENKYRENHKPRHGKR